MCKLHKITACANGSLRRNDRNNVMIQHFHQQFYGRKPDPRISFRQRIDPQHHHCTHYFFWQHVPGACSMAKNKIFLELFNILPSHTYIGKLSKTGRHTIDYLALGYPAINKFSCLNNFSLRSWTQPRTGCFVCEVKYLRNSKPIAIEDVVFHNKTVGVIEIIGLM